MRSDTDRMLFDLMTARLRETDQRAVTVEALQHHAEELRQSAEYLFNLALTLRDVVAGKDGRGKVDLTFEEHGR